MHEICRRLIKYGHKIHAVTCWHPQLKHFEKIEGYTVERVGNDLTYPLYIPYIITKYIKYIDVIVEDTSKIPLFTPLLRMKTSPPVVAIVHHLNRDIYFQELPLHKATIAYILETLMPKLYTTLPNTILIAVSESTKQELIKLGADPKRIYIVPNAVDISTCTQAPPENKNCNPTILYLSRLKAYKQPHHVIKAFRKLIKSIPNAKLVIAGKGTSHLRKLIAKTHLEHIIEVKGEIDNKSKIDLLQKAWVLVQTSRKEGFGITVLEAAACKTPTIAYNVPGLRDSIKHMETGILVPLNDIESLTQAITTLLLTPNLRRKLAENAYRYALKHNWEKTARKFEKIIEELNHE